MVISGVGWGGEEDLPSAFNSHSLTLCFLHEHTAKGILGKIGSKQHFNCLEKYSLGINIRM